MRGCCVTRTTRTSELSRSDQAVTRSIGRAYQAHTSEGPITLVYSLSNVYRRENGEVTLEFVTRLGHDLQDESCSPEVRSLGSTLLRWKHQIAAWHEAQITNSPTEAANNFIKRVKRSASVFATFVTTESELCSTQEDPTGHYSPRSHPANFR